MKALPQFAAFLLLLGTVACENPDTQVLRQKLEQESDPGDRAKIAVKIGENILEEMGQSYKDGDYQKGKAQLDDYMELCRASYRELQESGREARRKPKGFKEMEIHLRKGRRQLLELARRVPLDQRPPIEEAVGEVTDLRNALLFALMGLDVGKQSGPKEEK